MTSVNLESVTKVYSTGVVAVRDLGLRVEPGELLVLVGPSGCGKTTTLRLIAGLETPSSGTVRLDGRVVNDVPPSRRNLALMFQRPVLYPHKSVRDNLALGWSPNPSQARPWYSLFLPRRLAAGAEINARVSEVAGMLGLEGMLDHHPAQLSGGLQQRVALGRCLIRRPGLLLLDEPLSNLDANLRTTTRRALRQLQRQLKMTVICVTHDPAEAMALGDRVAVMALGRIVQIARPQVLIHEPVNSFVASFVGWPPMNLIDGELRACDGEMHFVGCAGSVAVPNSLADAWSALQNRPIRLGIPPEDLSAHASGAGFALEIRALEPWGRGIMIVAGKESLEITLWRKEDCQKPGAGDTMAIGSSVMVQMNWKNSILFDRQTGDVLCARSTG
jgi:ABC-type sugar transport system ATPase subunit